MKNVRIADSCNCNVSEIESFIPYAIYPSNKGNIILNGKATEMGSWERTVKIQYEFEKQTMTVYLQMKAKIVKDYPYNAASPRKLEKDKPLVVLNLEEVKSRIKYPDIARENQIEGTVKLKIWVDERGNYFRHYVLESSHAILLEAIEAHIGELVFKPAIENYVPVPATIEIPFRFVLAEGGKFNMKVVFE